jgi:hypothetical protein
MEWDMGIFVSCHDFFPMCWVWIGIWDMCCKRKSRGIAFWYILFLSSLSFFLSIHVYFHLEGFGYGKMHMGEWVRNKRNMV